VRRQAACEASAARSGHFGDSLCAARCGRRAGLPLQGPMHGSAASSSVRPACAVRSAAVYSVCRAIIRHAASVRALSTGPAGFEEGALL
jgi:hypothetical protein